MSTFMARTPTLHPVPHQVIESLMLFGIPGFVLHQNSLVNEQLTISHRETGARVSGGETKEEAMRNALNRIPIVAKLHNRHERDEILHALQVVRARITVFENRTWNG